MSCFSQVPGIHKSTKYDEKQLTLFTSTYSHVICSMTVALGQIQHYHREEKWGLNCFSKLG